MAIYLLSLFGSASIGVYSLATDKMVLIPPEASESKAGKVENWLCVNLARTTIGGSVLLGALVCANSNGVVLPHYVRKKELRTIKKVANDANLAILETKKTSYGNMVLTNDYGAVVDPRLKPSTIEKISDTLGVEAVPGEIAGLPYVGSLALATNKGVLAHPLIREEEKQLLKKILKVPVDVGTINCGIPYVATGLIGNSNNVVAGFLSTGPEMFIIGQALEVVS
ncbi:MAG: translation initiation factor IF-6 [Candidatus Bathyarchaeota archaeon]|nr:MAG: translation initiation factor IF-6 [Candidatus Bathyarchaeota archaeon]